MNISTGGPHILLFERDQQLAVLLTSEFQLAGYESHTARTAVEVFDAIARNPIKIVLVNVAQAAAARREFWVALDTQRRGRGVQVLTFRCMNIAGYGPYDAEDRSQAMVDSEVDGMLGIMGLVDTVRARIPGNGMRANTGTMPRISRMTTPPPANQMPPGPLRAAAPPPSPTLNSLFASAPAARPSLTDNMQPPSRPVAPIQPPTSPLAASPGSAPMAEAQPIQVEMSSNNTFNTNTNTNANPSTYTDKIRAVLYPNQRVWTPQGNSTTSTMPESKSTYEPTGSAVSASTASANSGEATTLQRLASGQVGMENPQESGLAQLSRMLQERQTQQRGIDSSVKNNYAYQPVIEPVVEEPPLAAPNGSQGVRNAGTATTVNTAPINHAPPASRPMPTAENITISAQPLRASPIQDIPVERPISGQVNMEGARRTEGLIRAAYAPPSPVQATVSPLASIATPPTATPPAPAPIRVVPPTLPPAPVATPVSTPPMAPPVSTPSVIPVEEKEEEYITEEPEEQTLHQVAGELISNEKAKSKPVFKETILEDASTLARGRIEGNSTMPPNNAVLLDIMQSLPPMPPPQVQVLNGRATRTLGSVLLEGHLVPESRLEVAQHIQRMLRGVDLNYQLGEILLMFKLLTPDQLLAASLVSYGLITTAQISALGRIRQELHSIGLEYDLENLLILFRILTPEQLREVRSSWQG
jgi:hypothetical protein